MISKIDVNAIGPAIVGVSSFLFGVPVATVIAGFAGAWLGLAVGGACSVARGALVVGAGTIVAGYLTPGVLFFVGEIPQRPAAAIIGFFVAHKESQAWLIERVKSWLTK